MKIKTTVTVYVPIDKFDLFEQMIHGYNNKVYFYSQQMVYPKCIQVNLDIDKFNDYKHLLK